jgi:hypothetical protein
MGAVGGSFLTSATPFIVWPFSFSIRFGSNWHVRNAALPFIFWNDWPQKSTENTKEKSGSEGLGSMGFGQSVFFERRGMASAAGITTPQKG